MVNVNELDDRILQRILHLACRAVYAPTTRLRAYGRLLPLAAVCRSWRRHASKHLHSTLIAEFQPPVPHGAVEAREGKEKPCAPNTRRKSLWSGIVFASKTYAAHAGEDAGVSPGRGSWKTNMPLVRGRRSVGTTKLRIQMYTGCCPDYEGFAAAIDLRALKESGRQVECIEFADFSALQGATAWRYSQQGLAGRHERHTLGKLAAYVGMHLPSVSAIVCSSPWDMCATNRRLATLLLVHYVGQLSMWNVPVVADKTLQQAVASAAAAGALSSLHIETHVLEQLGGARLDAGPLQCLHLRQAEPFFSWAAFASNSQGVVAFERLHTLAIDFARDDVANDTHRFDALHRANGGKNSARVTMGANSCALSFPALHTLALRRVPYTYAAAWDMFADAPIRHLSVAGKYGHLRHISRALLERLDFVDVHMYGIAGPGTHGRFTAFVKQLLGYASQARSAWLRHAEDAFPLSVPAASLGWAQLRELNVAGYLPPFALLTLVEQLPRLHRLVVQRVALDANEPLLDDDAAVLGLRDARARAVASSTVRELQVHMGGSQLRASTLQVLCCLLAAMPRVRKLAIKHGYRLHVLRFIAMHAEELPGLQGIQMVQHVHMEHVPAHSPQ
ncbi:hypothetical protein GGI23_000577 [Coemansia sp. RSA 2559]|nr:hypothetical protein GGI23_000577 [Coemansia sp. RSA 2559]KAJ2868594.1 hypothetical protein GGI22_000789 [Coemansia erecta]